MLTVDFARFPVGPGDAVLDLGTGGGRHAFEVFRRGADVVALDRDAAPLADVQALLTAMRAEGQAPAGASARALQGDAGALPFRASTFDRVIAAEVLEHLADDETAIAELARVLRPGGLAAITVPRWLPERVCWALSDAYHEVEGGHVRIYRRRDLQSKLARAGLRHVASHHAHALHAPYWWLKCALDDDAGDSHGLPALYHRLLVWDIMRRPLLTRAVEAGLNPLIGKSLVLYARKSEVVRAAA